MQRLGRASAVGIELAVAVIGCLLAGTWADTKLGTGPWLALAGLILGSLAGFRSLWRAAQASAAEDDEPPGPPPGPPEPPS
jgi:F0F1-type ATP synthase assembly protein I